MAEDMIPWLYGLQHFGIKLGLDNIRAVLAMLGHPERAFRSLHVAGTNGKGSVAAMVDAILRSAGVSSGLFTSPHLVRPHERIRLRGEDIEDAELQRRLATLRGRIEISLAEGRLEAHPSFFEVVTAVALEAFSDHDLRAAVLEVGLGGRLDATNAVDADVAVIVSIGMDHVKTLGPTLEHIAWEKAGIIKAGQPVICGATQQQVLGLLREICDDRGARLIDARGAVRLAAQDGERFALETALGRYDHLTCALPGNHQIDNARVALAAYEQIAGRLGVAPRPDDVRRGLETVRWAGRLQWREPADGLPRLLFDGAHNPPGITALVAYLDRLDRGKPVLLAGATSGKPLIELVGPLASRVRGTVLTRPPVQRGLDPREVADEIEPAFGRVEALDDPAEALERACRMAGDDGWVLVTGSIYLVGAILRLLAREEAPGPVSM